MIDFYILLNDKWLFVGYYGYTRTNYWEPGLQKRPWLDVYRAFS